MCDITQFFNALILPFINSALIFHFSGVAWDKYINYLGLPVTSEILDIWSNFLQGTTIQTLRLLFQFSEFSVLTVELLLYQFLFEENKRQRWLTVFLENYYIAIKKILPEKSRNCDKLFLTSFLQTEL